MNTFHLNITASSGEFYNGLCESMILPTKDGDYGIMADHCRTLVGIRMGELRYKVDGEWFTVVVGVGFADINDYEAVVLVDSAERPEDIDFVRAEAARQRAAERLQHKVSMREYAQSKIALTRAMERLKVRNRR